MATNLAPAQVQIDYIAKDFDSVIDDLINFATTNFGPGTASNRIWTDFNTSSFSRTWAELIAYVSDLLFFYLDNQATEAYLESATLQSSLMSIAQQFGYIIPSAASSGGTAVFTATGVATIPFGFRVSDNSGNSFFVTQASSIGAAGSLSAPVIQGTQVTDAFTAQGIQNEEFTLSQPNLVIDTTNIVASLLSPIVTVNSVTWSQVDTFITSSPTDTVYQVMLNPNGSSSIEFGDGIFGQRLNPGSIVQVFYRVGGGTIGNIGANTLTNLVDTAINISAVNNPANFSGGTDSPTLNQLRQLIPASLSTLNRAVTADDYANIILLNFPQIADASASILNTAAGIDINIYLVPVGTTVTQITSNPNLLASIGAFLNTHKMVTTQYSLQNGYNLAVQITVKVYLNSNASQSVIAANINSALLAYLNFSTGTISPNGTGPTFGQVIRLSDIYNLIQSISGITRFDITQLNYQPRVEAGVNNLNNIVFSEIESLPNSGEYEYFIVTEASGGINTDIDQYEVYQREYFTVSNLSNDSISDDTADFSVLTSTGTLTGAILQDTGGQIFTTNQWVPGYLLADSNGNVFEIVSNTNNTITLNLAPPWTNTSTFADGTYYIVQDLRDIGQGGPYKSNLLFNNNILSIYYNNVNTIYVIPGAGLLSIGTLGDAFILSIKLTDEHITADVTSVTGGSGVLILQLSNTNLTGVLPGYVLIDSAGSVFSILQTDEIDDKITVSTSSAYPATGNAIIALPTNIPIPLIETSISATATPGVYQLSASLDKAQIVGGDLLIDNTGVANEILSAPYVVFANSPPTTYTYTITPNTVVVFDNSVPVTYTYTSGTGVIQYASAVDLSAVVPGDQFIDGASAAFTIISVNHSGNSVTIPTGQTVNTSGGGSINNGSSSGLIQYAAPVDLSNVIVDIDYFRDSNGIDYQIIAFSTALYIVRIVNNPSSIGLTSSAYLGGSIRSFSRIELVTGYTPPSLGAGGTLTRRYFSPGDGVTWMASYNGQAASTGYPNIDDLGYEINSTNEADTFTIRTTPQVGDIINVRDDEVPTLVSQNIILELLGGQS